MHFGPYTLERQLAGSERVGRFVASRPEADGTKSVLTVDIPTPEARRDPAFLRDFEACIGATLGLDHPHLLPPLEHGVDEGVPYLAHAHISGLTLAEIDTALRLEGTPWFAEVVTFILHRVAMACRYLAQYVGLPRDVEASHVVLGDAGEVYVDAFVLLGGWTGIQPGHADIPDVLRRLGASLHGGLPPELAPLLATWSNVPATWLTELEAHVSAEAQTLLAETVRALLAARPEPADVTTDAPPSDQNDDIPVRRRFRRTQLAPVPNSSTGAETVVHATNTGTTEQSGDMQVPVLRGLTQEMDVPPAPSPPPPPPYDVHAADDATREPPPLARLTVEAPAYEPVPSPSSSLFEPATTRRSNSVQLASGHSTERSASRHARRGERALVWKIGWMLGCITTGVLLGLLATAMLGFGPLVASTPDAPLPEARRTDEP